MKRTADPSGWGPSSLPGGQRSWWSSLGLYETTRPGDLDEWPILHDAPGDSAAPTAPPRDGSPSTASPAEAPTALQRVFTMFTVARALLGAALLLVQLLLNASAIARHVGIGSMVVLAACAAYALVTLGTARVARHARNVASRRGRLSRRWFVATVCVDLVAFTLLMLLVGPQLNVAALFALPVLMAAALTGRRTGLAVAAGAALALLAGAGLLNAEGDLATVLMQAGFAGAGLFAVAALTSELALRLVREERTARSTLALARQQALLNRLVIEEMQDGVLVVDRAAQVRAANPAALALIGAATRPHRPSFSLLGRADWQPLVQAIEQAYAGEWAAGQAGWPDGGQDLHLRLDPEHAGEAPAERMEERSLRLRMRFARRREREIGEALCVLFLEDVRTVRARARQEKLAAMGRVSVGIAHEIRNPLAAISQANALLAEDLQQPDLQRLAGIVTDNVARLRRIVDDVMAAAPGGPAEPAGVVDLGSLVGGLCAEWLRTNQLPAGLDSPVTVHPGDEILPIRFDPEHLRRVLVNLLDNAWRHCSQTAGAIVVRAQAAEAHQVRLSVASDGEPITPEVERHLFEPFFSTRSRGSGLGLYICRELCARHGATIDYRTADRLVRHRNVFVVSVPTPATHEPPAPALSLLSTPR